MPGTDVVTTPPARDLAPAAAGPEAARLAAAAAAYADAQMASSTRRAYESDWADFTAWCAKHPPAVPLPAPGPVVALYLADRAQGGLAVSTLSRRLAAIRTIHKSADHPPPAGSELLAVWAGIRRTHGRPPRQKRAIITEDLRRIVARLPTTPSGVRDKALILVSYAAALRRSESAVLELDDGKSLRRGIRLEWVARGFRIVIDASKADQEGEGAVIAVPYGKTKLCAGVALNAWLELARISSGPVFRPVDRHGNIAPRAMSEKAVNDTIKRAAARAKIDPALIGGHSLRSGMVTQAIMNEVAVPLIMKQTRHVKVDTLNRYVRMAGDMDRSAGGKLGL